MTEPTPTRRDLMKPVQLLGFAFGAAVFAGVVTLISMGFFQDQVVTQTQRGQVIVVALIVAGIAFIATLLIIALLMLAVDPSQITRKVDTAVLLPDADIGDGADVGDGADAGDQADDADGGAPGAGDASDAADPADERGTADRADEPEAPGATDESGAADESDAADEPGAAASGSDS